MIEVFPYQQVGGLSFDARPDDVEGLLGRPSTQRQGRSGELIYHYPDRIIYFDLQSRMIRECAFDDSQTIKLPTLIFDWSPENIAALLRLDGTPLINYDTVYLFSLGAAIFGHQLDDSEYSDRSISLFRKSAFDDLKPHMKPLWD